MLSETLPLKVDWTTVLFAESNDELWNWIGLKLVTTVVQVSIFEPSDCWLEIAILSEESTVGGVRIDWIEKENNDDREVLVSPETVIYVRFTGEAMVVYEQLIVLAVFVMAEQIGVVMTVLLLSRSFVQVNGKSNTTWLVELIWFFGVRVTTNFDRVKIVAFYADILYNRNVPGVNVNVGK